MRLGTRTAADGASLCVRIPKANLNGTDPAVFVDYTKQENNVNTLK